MEKESVQLYVVSKEVAERTGFAKQRYVTKDGKYIINDRDLRIAQLTEIEKNSLEKITKQQSKQLIAENGYKTGNSISETK